MKRTLLLLMLLFVIFGQAQKKETFKFVVEKRDTVPGMHGFYIGIEKEFTRNRIVYIDSTFEEQDLFISGVPFIYKLVKGKGYVKKGNKWNLFYSADEKTAVKTSYKMVTGKNLILTLQGLGNDSVFGIPCAKYQLESLDADNTIIDSKGNKITSSINHLDTIFWFSPKYGFIKEYFGDYGIAVFREDILAKK